MTAPLMPKATAVWLVENTTLTFKQIADFCELHELEVQAIADGDVAFNIIGISPIDNNQLTLEEIARCEADKRAGLVACVVERNVKIRNAKSKKMLSPSQRNDKPAAILWVIKNCPEIIDSQICKLIGTTKPTIASIRSGTHREMSGISPKNPVAVGLCTEKDLEKAIAISKARNEPKKPKAKKKVTKKATVKKAAPAKKTTAKKAAVKKAAPAKKTTAKKAAVKKAAPAKKTAAKKAAVKKAAPAKKTAAKKVAVKKAAPAKKTVAKKATVKKAAPAKKAAVKKPATKKPTAKAKK